MNNLIKDTIEKIEARHIVPEPKWKYLAKNYVVWLFFTTVLILGSISLSVALYSSGSLDWDLYGFMHQNRLVYFLSLLPYFWIVLIAAFLAAAFFEIRRTETGYRYSWFKILTIIIGGISLLGAFMSSIGLGGKFNAVLSNNISLYGQHMVVTKESQWMQPAKGFLAGTITSISKANLIINDLNGEAWNIQLDEKTLIKPSVNISSGEIVKIIGAEIDADNFRADEIRPWMGRGNGRGMNSKMMNGAMMQGK